MANDTARYRTLDLSDTFTPKGKRGTLPWIPNTGLGAAASFLVLLTSTTPAAANTEVGSTSSASVGISVSVVPSFRLASTEPLLDKSINPAGYCIATNGEPMTLPVLLVQANDGKVSDRSANQLPWCDAGTGRQQDQTDANYRKPLRLLIIRPE